MEKAKAHKNTNMPKINTNTVLSTPLICAILEATGRFEFIVENEVSNTISFWDNYWEKGYHVGRNWTLKKLIQWLTQLYAEDYEQRGISKAQNNFKKALGL